MTRRFLSGLRVLCVASLLPGAAIAATVPQSAPRAADPVPSVAGALAALGAEFDADAA